MHYDRTNERLKQEDIIAAWKTAELCQHDEKSNGRNASTLPLNRVASHIVLANAE